MENFDGFLGAIAVSGMRAGLNKDTTINLVVSLSRISGGFKPITVLLLQDTNPLPGLRRYWQSCSWCAQGECLPHRRKWEYSR